MRKRWYAGVILLFVGFTGKLLWDAGAFTTLTFHGTEGCRVLAPLRGAEDMEIVGRTLYVSADNRPQHPGTPTPHGDLYTVDLSRPGSLPVRLTPDLPFTFHPHGLGTVNLGDRVRLFVVNHREDESVIEVFDHAPGGPLAHMRTVRAPELITPNDVAALDGDRFYVTNDHGSRSELAKKFEGYSRIGRGNLLFFDGQSFRQEAGHLNFANGLWLSADQRHLFLALMLSKEVRVYQREAEGLTVVRKIKLPGAPDNLQLDAQGDLWVAVHPKALSLKAHAENHLLPAPSRVLRVLRPIEGNHAPEDMLTDDGKIVAAASIAVPDGKRMFLGTIFTEQLMECPIR